MTNTQKAARLRLAIDALHNADAWVQEALGDSDVCYETHNRIQDLIDDLMHDVQEFEEGVL
jgi:hypothetical protein